MSERCTYLHIGLPKTGTTSIQLFLTLNEVALLERGLLYPKTGRYGLNHAGLIAELRGWLDEARVPTLEPGVAAPTVELGFPTPESGSATFRQLREEIDAFPGSAVISLESLAGLSCRPVVEKIACALEGHEVRVIVSLRRQDLYVFAFWQQLIQTAHTTLSFEQYLDGFYERGLENTVLNYGAVLDAWAEHFGPERVTVGVYESRSMPDAVTFARHAMGIDEGEDDDLIDPPRVNTTGPTPLFEFFSRQYVPWRMRHEGDLSVRELHERYWAPHRLRALLEGLDADRLPSYINRYFPPARRIELLNACESFNEHVARRYLGRSSGVLFQAPRPRASDPAEPAPTTGEDRSTHDELVCMLLEMVLALQQQVASLEASAEG